jgi:myotubularin-related protein 5/13
MCSYDGVSQCIPDSFTFLLEETNRCEHDLERLPQKWRQIWDKLELPPTDSFNVSNFIVLQAVHSVY